MTNVLTWETLMARKGAPDAPEPPPASVLPPDMLPTAPEPPASAGAAASYRRALGRDLTPREEIQAAVIEAARAPDAEGLPSGGLVPDLEQVLATRPDLFEVKPAAEPLEGVAVVEGPTVRLRPGHPPEVVSTGDPDFKPGDDHDEDGASE